MQPKYLDAVDPEFKDIVGIPDDNGLLPMDYDIANPPESYRQDDELDDFVKIFSQAELQKRSRLEPARTAPPPNQGRPESKPEETETCEEFFGLCEKRATPGKVRFSKRLVPETDEIMVEAWNSTGECISTRFIPAGAEIPEDSPLAKASVTDAMNKTLAQIRAALLPEEFEAARKAVAALDVDLFLQICRRAQVTA